MSSGKMRQHFDIAARRIWRVLENNSDVFELISCRSHPSPCPSCRVLISEVSAIRVSPVIELLDIRVQIDSSNPAALNRRDVVLKVRHHPIEEFLARDHARLASWKPSNNCEFEQSSRESG